MFAEDIHNRQVRSVDALTAAFESHLQTAVNRASVRLGIYLQDKLSVTKGSVDHTPGNLRVIRNLDSVFMGYLNDAGYNRMLNAFVNEFPGQLPYLQEMLDLISKELKVPLPKIKFTARDLDLFQAFRVTSKSAITGAIKNVAARTVEQVNFSLGAMRFNDLVDFLGEKLDVTVPRATTLAETSATMFYRTATQRAFDKIDSELPGEEPTTYQFLNPMDKKTRPWCVAMVKRTQETGLTKDEINKYPNSQLANPFISGGGFGCRGQFVLHLGDLRKRLAEGGMLKAA